jgi:ABC-type Fe3+/spermidine/putrescine transport system ATPase subunit
VSDVLRIAGLTVRHGAAVVLDDLSLSVRRDELFVLLGASGSGKTTLLRAIAGFAPPSAGRIELDGRDIGALPPHRRPVNTVFQSYALFPHMTVAANIAFGLRGMDRTAAAARVKEMLALVRLEALADRRPHQLSGGQQQRVALARGLAPRPALLLLDEPLSALDRGLREETRDELVRLRRQLGTSFILVTHDQQEALTVADRVGVMSEGRLAQIGTPAEVYERPTNRLVAEFLGSANILPGVARGNGTVELQGLATVVATASSVPGPMLLALRPERIRMGEGGGINRLTGVLIASMYAGEALIHTVRLADGSTLRLTQSLQSGLSVGHPAEGAAVTVSWSPDACILLPP